jgi:hypothetical protein
MEAGKCGKYHFCRVSIDIGNWNNEPHVHTFVSEEVVGEGVAIKSKHDSQDEYVGENLALARAMGQLSRKLERRARGKVVFNDNRKASLKRKQELKALENRGDHRDWVFGIDLAVGEDKSVIPGDLFQNSYDDITEANERLIDEC